MASLPGHILPYETLKDVSISKLSNLITSAKSLPVEKIIFKKLILYNNKDAFSHGCYAFHNGKDIFYIGKTGSRSYIERIPAHFDIRKSAFFNSLLSNFISAENIQEPRSDYLITAYEKLSAFDLYLVLICYSDNNNNRKFIDYIELSLIHI